MEHRVPGRSHVSSSLTKIPPQQSSIHSRIIRQVSPANKLAEVQPCPFSKSDLPRSRFPFEIPVPFSSREDIDYHAVSLETLLLESNLKEKTRGDYWVPQLCIRLPPPRQVETQANNPMGKGTYFSKDEGSSGDSVSRAGEPRQNLAKRGLPQISGKNYPSCPIPATDDGCLRPGSGRNSPSSKSWRPLVTQNPLTLQKRDYINESPEAQSSPSLHMTFSGSTKGPVSTNPISRS